MKSGSSMNNYIYPKTMICDILHVYVCGCRTKSNSVVWVKPGSFGLLLTDYTRLNFCSQQHLSSYQNTPKINPKKSIFLDTAVAATITLNQMTDSLQCKKKRRAQGEREKASHVCAPAHTHTLQRKTLLQLNSAHLCTQNAITTGVLYLVVASFCVDIWLFCCFIKHMCIKKTHWIMKAR
jgi:hypothetical protein